MTIALPVTGVDTGPTDDARHYTPWNEKPRPVAVVNGEVIPPTEDPGTVEEGPKHYTAWQPKPRPAVVIPDVPDPVASDPGTVDEHSHYTAWSPKPRP